MTKMRLDQMLAVRGMVPTRSQAESYIKLGEVTVNGKIVTKPGQLVRDDAEVKLNVKEQYVSRAALKLASVASALKLDFRDKTMLDVGSSTGGFTDYALRHGLKKSIAVEVGTDQLHPSLRGNEKIELHEQTDIRDFRTTDVIDVVVADVSFISLRDILPAVSLLCTKKTDIVAMVKPQFEANVTRSANLKHKGVIKNDKMRRDILKSFEDWAKQYFITVDKADSDVAGAKGNQERFYKLRVL
jgi:23S rRNA (cytidine1920-2'-O)/16S rRNA (cytidine1409-2'-O)-methyltransferase